MINKWNEDPRIVRIETMNCALINTIIGLNYCTMCNKMSSFESFGINQRSKALCSNCRSLERHRLFYALIPSVFKNIYNSKILYIGRDAIFSKDIKNKNKNECSSLLINNEKTGIIFEGWVDYPYDYIICGDIIDHISNPKMFLKKIKSNMGAESFLIILHASCGEDRFNEIDSGEVTWDTELRNKYSDPTFEKLLSSVYEYEKISVKERFTEEQIKLFSINVNLDIYLCK